jgi:hypothetical protein
MRARQPIASADDTRQMAGFAASAGDPEIRLYCPQIGVFWQLFRD